MLNIQDLNLKPVHLTGRQCDDYIDAQSYFLH